MVEGVYFSSIRNEFIRTISSLLIFFFLQKNFIRTKAAKCKINNFPPLRSFFMQKAVVFVVSCSFIFVLLVCFGLICIFVRLKVFHKKIK